MGGKNDTGGVVWSLQGVAYRRGGVGGWGSFCSGMADHAARPVGAGSETGRDKGGGVPRRRVRGAGVGGGVTRGGWR